MAADPDDDLVLACAVAARANWIATGDQHLLGMTKFRRIRIGNASDILALLK
ncbi:MAG: PIN domain-containing protein [Chloroflexota bacterium]